MDIHDIKDDITSLCGSFYESSNRHSTQLSSIHHHHVEMVAIHDRRFMSLETRLEDFETRLDRQDARFTQILDSQRVIMDYLLLVFPHPAP